jgi:hypothetical protein
MFSSLSKNLSSNSLDLAGHPELFLNRGPWVIHGPDIVQSSSLSTFGFQSTPSYICNCYEVITLTGFAFKPSQQCDYHMLQLMLLSFLPMFDCFLQIDQRDLFTLKSTTICYSIKHSFICYSQLAMVSRCPLLSQNHINFL